MASLGKAIVTLTFTQVALTRSKAMALGVSSVTLSMPDKVHLPKCLPLLVISSVQNCSVDGCCVQMCCRGWMDGPSSVLQMLGLLTWSRARMKQKMEQKCDLRSEWHNTFFTWPAGVGCGGQHRVVMPSSPSGCIGARLGLLAPIRMPNVSE